MAAHPRPDAPRTRQHTLVIASEPLLAAWNACCGAAKDVVAVAARDTTALLDLIRRQQPGIVVLEETFAGSTGASLVAQLQADLEFRGMEIRLLSAERSAALQAAHATQDQEMARVATFARPVPLRRHVRLRPDLPVEVAIDGHPATLLDLSTTGIQVRSTLTLCPHQRVRVNLPQHGGSTGSIRTSGVVAWSAFEVRSAPTYRAGIRLREPLPATSEEILARVLAAQIVF